MDKPKINIVTNDLFKLSTKIADLPSRFKKVDAKKKPKTTGKNLIGPSRDSGQTIIKIICAFRNIDFNFF